MSVSYFDRKDEKPTVIVFENSLKVDEFRLWRKFSKTIMALYPNVTTEWEFISQKFGWFLAYKSNNKLLFYIVPDGFCFCVNFIFEDEAFAALDSLSLPVDVIGEIKRAKKIDRGHSVYWSVRETKDIEIAELLTQLQYEMSMKEKA